MFALDTIQNDSQHIVMKHISNSHKEGVHWTEPKLDLHSLPAFPEGNVIMVYQFDVEHTFTVPTAGTCEITVVNFQ